MMDRRVRKKRKEGVKKRKAMKQEMERVKKKNEKREEGACEKRALPLA